MKFTQQQYKDAVDLVREHNRAATSFVSRELNVGYLVAIDIMLKMEEDGVVTLPNYVGKRGVNK